MRRTHKILLMTLALLFSTIACNFATNLFSFEDDDYSYNDDYDYNSPDNNPSQSQSDSTDVVEGQTCPILLSDIMSAASAEGSDAEPQDDTRLVTFVVNGDQISNPQYETSVPSDLQDERDNIASQEEIWDYFAALIPQNQRQYLTEFSITTDGPDNTLAAVTQTQSDPNSWALEVDILDTTDTYNLTYTLIHEFGHLLTLNRDQVPPSEAVFNNPDDQDVLDAEKSACPQYFPGEGCSTSRSYINAFYNQFWTDIYDEWDEVNYVEDDDTYYTMLDDFYAKYQDQFVTGYAVTTPEEDIAESWTYFVLTPKPAGNTIAEEKILFFYDYPELVSLREKILQNLCLSFPSQ